MIERGFENNVTKSNIEKSANYEGNETLLFYERLQNQEIKKRIIDMICEYQETRNPPSQIFRNDENDNLVEVPISEWKNEIKPREQIEKELDERIEKVFSTTNLDYNETASSFSEGENDFGTVSFLSMNPENNEKWTTKQLSISEAHEKGHGVRNFTGAGGAFKSKIQSGLNFSNVEITDKMKGVWVANKQEDREFSDHEIRKEMIDYFMQPNEIIERMGQLKNYFGMKNTEEFTKEHLDYARKNYLSDTGFGMQMKPFLDAITPTTEKSFLELINSLGI
jgi:hypothetical protein